jgi:CHASE2 domain-containing sensor protein
VSIDPDQRRETRRQILLLAAGSALFWAVLLLFSPANWLPVASLLVFAVVSLYWASRLSRPGLHTRA